MAVAPIRRLRAGGADTANGVGPIHCHLDDQVSSGQHHGFYRYRSGVQVNGSYERGLDHGFDQYEFHHRSPRRHGSHRRFGPGHRPGPFPVALGPARGRPASTQLRPDH